MKNDIISIIVPIYNTEKYLDGCIESIVNQSYEKLEIILVNDGSTDGSNLICKKWKEQDNRIVLVDKENGGLVSARMAGLKIAKGNYVGFVDSDDFIHNRMYEKLLTEKKRTKADCVYCGLNNCYLKNEKMFITQDNNMFVKGAFNVSKDPVNFLVEHVFMAEREKQVYTGGICLGIYDRAFITEAYANVPEQCSQGEDLICMVWMILHANQIVYLEEKMYYYLIRNESLSHERKNNKYFEICNMIQEIRKICKEYAVSAKLDEAIEYYTNKLLCLELNLQNPALNMELYHFPDEEKLEGKQIVIYAKGTVGRSYFQQFTRNENIRIVSWVDKNSSKKHGLPNTLIDKEFDYVVIAVERISVYEDILQELLSMGIPQEKILWSIPKLNL